MDTGRDSGNDSSRFRDEVGTIDKKGKRIWLYPQKPKGKIYQLRSYLSYFYLLVFFGVPFLKVNEVPLFMFNVLERKFILFGMIFWPQDFFIFGMGFLIFIVFIALFTVVFGRVFCGWACPQTIFMEMIFRKIEYLIEGDSNYSKALDRQQWNTEKFLKRGTKYLSFFIISFLIANTLLSYIIGLDEVLKIVSDPIRLHISGFISILIFTGVFFFIYSWFREQVCLIVCPYGRMQGVLLDPNSIVVAYDFVRGEPRHKFRKNEDSGHGDCVDCNLCVKVCPTGIDIRNGTQLECINCTACIDACDEIMMGVNRPKGLIRYASEKEIKDKVPTRFTARIAAYSIVLLLLVVVEAFFIVGRSDVDATVLRARGTLYQDQPDDKISNLYSIKVLNKTFKDMPLNVKVENFPAEIRHIGSGLHLRKESMESGEFFIILKKNDVKERKTKLKLCLYSGDKKIKTIHVNFMSPYSFKK
jgi:cytochrome c oxidase accessory protein FixG